MGYVMFHERIAAGFQIKQDESVSTAMFIVAEVTDSSRMTANAIMRRARLDIVVNEESRMHKDQFGDLSLFGTCISSKIDVDKVSRSQTYHIDDALRESSIA